MTYHRNDTTADILHQHPDPGRCFAYCGAVDRAQRDAHLARSIAADARDYAARCRADGDHHPANTAEGDALAWQRRSATAYAHARAMYEQSR